MAASRVERWLLVVLMLTVGYLFVRAHDSNREVRALISDTAERLKGERRPTVGTVIPSLSGVTPSGVFVDLSLDDTDYLVMSVSPECLGTVQNLQPWKQVVDAAAGFATVWVTAGDPVAVEDLLKASGLRGAVLGEVPFAVHIALGLSVVPQTVVVRDGRVAASWVGSVDPAQVLSAISVGQH